MQVAQTAERPKTVQAVLAVGKSDIQRELDFIEHSICGNAAAERACAVFVEQLERSRACEAVLAASGETSVDDRALLLDHYLVVAHRIAQGFCERVQMQDS